MKTEIRNGFKFRGMKVIYGRKVLKVNFNKFYFRIIFLQFQYTRGDKGRSNHRKKSTLGNPTHRVSRRDPGKLKEMD